MILNEWDAPEFECAKCKLLVFLQKACYCETCDEVFCPECYEKHINPERKND